MCYKIDTKYWVCITFTTCMVHAWWNCCLIQLATKACNVALPADTVACCTAGYLQLARLGGDANDTKIRHTTYTTYTIHFLSFFSKIPMRPFTMKCIFCINPLWPIPRQPHTIAKLLSAALGTFKITFETISSPNAPSKRKGADTRLKNRPQLVYLLYQAPDAPTSVGIGFNLSSVSKRIPKKPLVRPLLLSL
jgi:hypothetical protein